MASRRKAWFWLQSYEDIQEIFELAVAEKKGSGVTGMKEWLEEELEEQAMSYWMNNQAQKC